MKITGPGVIQGRTADSKIEGQVKSDLKDLAKDILENSYSPLIETLF
jgi:hypothetical protein